MKSGGYACITTGLNEAATSSRCAAPPASAARQRHHCSAPPCCCRYCCWCIVWTSLQHLCPVKGLELLAEVVGPALLHPRVLLPCPPVHVLLRQAQQACSRVGVGARGARGWVGDWAGRQRWQGHYQPACKPHISMPPPPTNQPPPTNPCHHPPIMTLRARFLSNFCSSSITCTKPSLMPNSTCR